MNVEHLEVIDTVKYLKRGVQVVKEINDYLIGNPENTFINWKLSGMVKGGVFGEYLKMRNEGSILIANSILLYEGLPQRLSPRQLTYLERFDKKHDFRRNP